MMPRPGASTMGWLVTGLLAGGLLAWPAQADSAAPAGSAPAAPAEDAAAPQAPVAASVEADKTEVKLGEPVELTIRVHGGGEQTRWRLPASLDLDPFVELGRASRTEQQEGRSVQVLVLRVAAFEKLGDLEVPGIALVLEEDGGAGPPLAVPPVQIKVVSMMAGVTDPMPRDVAAPVEVVISDYRLLVLAGLVVSWLLLALVLRRQRAPIEARTRLLELPPPRRAHQIALERLQRILDADLLRNAQFHQYFKQISEVVREYLGNRYAFFALDLTSSELIAELRDRITPGLDLAVLEKMLQEADLVKFARLEPTAVMCSNAINSAFGMVEATRVPDEAESGGAAA